MTSCTYDADCISPTQTMTHINKDLTKSKTTDDGKAVTHLSLYNPPMCGPMTQLQRTADYQFQLIVHTTVKTNSIS